MSEVAKPLPKIRVQLDLSELEVERMNWMMDRCGLDTRKDLFNNSLTVLEWIIGEIVGGKKVASFNDDTKERTILSMPIFKNAERKAHAPERPTGLPSGGIIAVPIAN